MTSRSTRISSASSSAGELVAKRPGLTLRELATHPVTELQAVGPKLQTGLAEMGITTVLDLLEHYPRRYLDRTQRAEIRELSLGVEATVDAEVRSIHSRRTRDGKRTIVNATVYDGTGLLDIVFFNQGWRSKQLPPGTQVSLFGKVESYRGKRQMTNPAVDVLAAPDAERAPDDGAEMTGTVVPVYPQSGKAEVHTWQLRRAVASCLERTRLRGFADPLDAALRADHELVDRTSAYHGHPSPRSDRDARVRRTPTQVRRVPAHAARVGGAQACARSRSDGRATPDRRSARSRVPRRHCRSRSPATSSEPSIRSRATSRSAHRCTGCCKERSGSGKTVVALTALLTAVQGGYQGAFMAPTEVLAEQHELTMRSLAERSRGSRRRDAHGRASGARGAAHQSHTGRGAPFDRSRSARG